MTINIMDKTAKAVLSNDPTDLTPRDTNSWNVTYFMDGPSNYYKAPF